MPRPTYVPVCRKTTQIAALSRLGAIASEIRPFFSFPPLDRGTEPSKTLVEKRIVGAATTIGRAWQFQSPVLVDLTDASRIGQAFGLRVGKIFQQRIWGFSTPWLPVLDLRASGEMLESTRKLLPICRGFGLKVQPYELSQQNLDRFLSEFSPLPEFTCLIIEAGRLSGQENDTRLSSEIVRLLGAIETLSKWDEIVVLAGSYPFTSECSRESVRIAPRHEGDFFKQLRSCGSEIGRELVPGDWLGTTPESQARGGSGAVKTPAMGYTTSKNWLISRGFSERGKPSSANYAEVAKPIVRHREFRGRIGSTNAGDLYYRRVAAGKVQDVDAPGVMRAFTLSHIEFMVTELGKSKRDAA